MRSGGLSSTHLSFGEASKPSPSAGEPLATLPNIYVLVADSVSQFALNRLLPRFFDLLTSRLTPISSLYAAPIVDCGHSYDAYLQKLRMKVDKGPLPPRSYLRSILLLAGYPAMILGGPRKPREVIRSPRRT